MSGNYTDKVANELADLALADEAASGEEKFAEKIGEILGASSQTLQESFLTAVRVRRAEARARAFLADRAAARERGEVAPDARAALEEAAETEEALEEPVAKAPVPEPAASPAKPASAPIVTKPMLQFTRKKPDAG